MGRRRAIELGLVLLAAAAALVPVPGRIVETWFSAGVYPRVQQVLTPVTNLVPFAVFDLILVAVVVSAIAVVVSAVREARRRRAWQPLLQHVWFLVVGAAAVYVAFLALWGMNYRRIAMDQRVELSSEPPSREKVLDLGATAAARMNELYRRAHMTGWPGNEWRDARFVEAFHDAQRSLTESPAVVPGRLKHSLLGPYFRWTGVDGMVDPFGLEVLVNPDLLPWERPFVAAHEWSHLAGFASESEASFVGWLSCMRGDPPSQYSGWLYVFWQVSGEVGPRDRDSLLAMLHEGPRRDVSAVVERLRRGQLPVLRTASWAVYDQYLRANRVEEGIRSYDEAITLILQTRFEDGYRPVRRLTPAPSR